MQAFDKALLRVPYGYYVTGSYVRILHVDGDRARVIGNDAPDASKAFDVKVSELCKAGNTAECDALFMLSVCENIHNLSGSLAHSAEHTVGLYEKYRETMTRCGERASVPSEARAAIDYAFDELAAIGAICVADERAGRRPPPGHVMEAQREVDRMMRVIRYAMLGEQTKVEVADGERDESGVEA